MCSMTPEEKQRLFENMGAIKANQENIKEDIKEIKKDYKGLVGTVTDLSIKVAKEAGGIAILMALISSVVINAITKYFSWGGQ